MAKWILITSKHCRCSECGYIVTNETKEKECQNCGRYMDEVKHDANCDKCLQSWMNEYPF